MRASLSNARDRTAFGNSPPAAAQNLADRISDLYPDRAAEVHGLVRDRIDRAVRDRPEWLVRIDKAKATDTAWISRSGQIVYTFYVDRFAGSLEGLMGQLDYLQALGVRWLHPLPLLKSREGDSDGGFAVADYRDVDPSLGTMADLERLAAALGERGMGLILDVVCNHTAREHEWAVGARAGDARFRSFYRVLDDKAEVETWERTLIDVFPDTAPGSFTHEPEMGGWVWTTFYPFQWDLDYRNPDVFIEMLDVLLFLANKGAQGFRLDSAPFLWKRPGTSCRNQPESYAIVEAFRAALSLAAPGVVLLAEAIESMEDVLPFFGSAAPGCELAYNNGVMTALWGALADGDARIVDRVLRAAARRPDSAAWLNYVRCHDDLIWNALASYATPDDLARWSAHYDGKGFSSGRRFQTPPEGVPSTNGMAASLVGIGKPGIDQDLAAARLCLMYGVIHALDGWPLIYMGDEFGLTNDEAYVNDPARRDEGRWLHRPAMDWAQAHAAERRGADTAGRLFASMRLFGEAARNLDALGVKGRTLPLDVGDTGVLACSRDDGRAFICLANLTAEQRTVTLPSETGPGTDVLTGTPLAGEINLEPYQVIWWAAAS